MTTPVSRMADLQGAAGSALPALPCPRYSVLKKRADFVAASNARRQASRSFILQARRRQPDLPRVCDAQIRVGFTCSKKVGNAVARNRAKRRLRAAAYAVLRQHGQPGWDYVLVGRRDMTANIEFAQLIADLQTALSRIHTPKPAP